MTRAGPIWPAFLSQVHSPMAKPFLAFAGIAVMIATPLPADARSHRRAHHPAKPAAQAPQDAAQDDKSSSDKASADIDKAMQRSLKSICRGC